MRHTGKKLKFLLLTCCLLSPLSYALNIQLDACIKSEYKFTDIEFLDGEAFLATAQTGELLYFSACNRPAQLIKHFDVHSYSELGLLGVAISPDKQHIFLYYSPENAQERITRLSAFTFSTAEKKENKTLTPPPALAAEKILMEFSQPYGNHDGGALKIGPDGNVYLGVGDGGSAKDPHNHGQNFTTLLGSIIRITPELSSKKGYTIPKGNLIDFYPDAAPEILAAGLRNPWKMSFDNSGNLIVADVGQYTYEEVSIIPAEAIGNVALNLGWRLKEGDACFNPSTDCDRPGLLAPAFVYERDFGASITGGETLMHEGKEYYVFADYVSGAIGVLQLAQPGKLLIDYRPERNAWSSFGKSVNGSVLIANLKGEIFTVTLK